VIPSYDESEPIFDRLFDEVYGYVHRQGVRHAGCGIAVYHTAEVQENDIEVEAVAPVYQLLRGNEHVQVYELPAVEQMACVVHHGPLQPLVRPTGRFTPGLRTTATTLLARAANLPAL